MSDSEEIRTRLQPTAIRIWWRCVRCGVHGSFREDDHADIEWRLRMASRVHVESGECRAGGEL